MNTIFPQVVPGSAIKFSVKILQGIFEGRHYFFCLTLFPSKQTTTLLQRSFLSTYSTTFSLKAASRLPFRSILSSSCHLCTERWPGSSAQKKLRTSTLTNLRGRGMGQVPFFLAGQIARVLFDGGYYLKCRYYSRKYGI